MHKRATRAESEAARLLGELHAERHAASHDPLTGLPNRRAFHRLGSALVADPSRHPLIAVVLDLDDFKQVNDRFGHAAGDEVLITVGRRLANYAGDNLVARLGGDEFAGLLRTDSVDERWLHHTTKRLVDTLAAPIHVAGHVVTVTASVGLALLHGPGRLSDALRHADAAMYRAKTWSQAGTPTPILADDLLGYSAIRPSAPVRDLAFDLHLTGELAMSPSWAGYPGVPSAPGWPTGRPLVDITARNEAGG
jgi:diguanylate cyclase (GGDEF)-like protein